FRPQYTSSPEGPLVGIQAQPPMGAPMPVRTKKTKMRRKIINLPDAAFLSHLPALGRKQERPEGSRNRLKSLWYVAFWQQRVTCSTNIPVSFEPSIEATNLPLFDAFHSECRQLYKPTNRIRCSFARPTSQSSQ